MKKLLFLLLSICLFSVNTFAQTADEIVNKHIEATGGTEKWKALKTISKTHTMNTGGFEVSMKEDVIVGKAVKRVVTVMGNDIISAVNGDTGWKIAPAMMGGTGDVEDMSADEMQETKRQISVTSPLISAKENGSTLELIGKEKLDGTDVFNIKSTNKDGKTSNLFVDASSFYLLKAKTVQMVRGNDMDIEISFSNFKQVDGLTFPFEMEVPNPRMGGMMTIETQEIKTNPTIDEAIFAKPIKK